MTTTIKFFLCGLLFIVSFNLCFAQQDTLTDKQSINEFHYWVYSYPETKRQPLKTGFDAMESPERLPYLFPTGTQTKQFCSHDVTAANGDGNFSNAFTRYIDSNGENVIFDEYGPGCLYRQQINIWIGGNNFQLHPNAGKAKIKYYFDDETKPRIDCTIDELFNGKGSPFYLPLSFKDYISRFAVSYYSLTFKKRLKVTVSPASSWEGRVGTWYQYTYLKYSPNYAIESWNPSTLPNEKVIRQWTNSGTDPKDTTGNIPLKYTQPIKVGDSLVINLENPGSVASLKVNIDPYSIRSFYDTQILIYWDNQSKPAVNVPLGQFFGGGTRDYWLESIDIPARSLKSLFYGFDGATHSFYSYWPMPFWKKARIVFINKSDTDIADLTCHIGFKPESAYAYSKSETGYFNAERTIFNKWTPEKPYIIAFKKKGRGHVVGISFYSANYDMDGDEFTYIDGSLTPQIHGDGTEDDHNQGFGGSNYNKPLWGGLMNGYQGGYRIYMNDAYVFNNNIEIRYEQPRKEAQTDVLTYYYMSAFNDTIKLTDKVDIGNKESEKQHNYRVEGQTWEGTLASCYDGYQIKPDYYQAEDNGRAFNKKSSFVVNIDPANEGVRLRKRIYRRNHGQQTAWVYVDGVKIQSPWYIATYSKTPVNQSWYDSDFEIPSTYTKGKKQIKVQIKCVEVQ